MASSVATSSRLGIITDGNKAYLGLQEYYLKQIVNMPEELTLHWTRCVISLLKTLGLGTYHGYPPTSSAP